jgi:ATP-dependent helicase HepA
MQSTLTPGQVVRLRADSSRVGSVIAVLPPIGGQPRYQVFHSAGDIREYVHDQIVVVDVSISRNAIDEALASGRWLDSATFRARLTAERLGHPLVDSLYALHAARIQYVPFQFKPLMRFLRADQPRLLIADEVGVGKTIEAGLILKELEARQQVGNVLVVCPKALVSKWRTEMRRFDEDFFALDSKQLAHCLHETHLEGVWPSQFPRAIIHLELFRAEEYLQGSEGKRARPGLLTLTPPPQFTLTIIDEAHHLRNPGTNSHELARFLCEISEAVLFLSATPVHVGSRNLFTLLNLLRPDMFQDEAVFAEVVEPNQYITKAIRHVRAKAPAGTWQADAAGALTEASITVWGRNVLAQDDRFAHWRMALAASAPVSDGERIACLRDLEEVHPLAHIMNRTRRRDIGAFTIREPHTVAVPFTPAQQAFYDALIRFRQAALLERYDPQVIRLITDTLQRQAASCLPAMVATLDRFLAAGSLELSEFTDARLGREVHRPRA